MMKLKFFAVVLAMLTVAATSRQQESAGGLELSLSPAKIVGRTGGPIGVTVTIRNTGTSGIAILPTLFPPHARSVLGGLPTNILSFQIKRDDGTVAPSLRTPGEWSKAVLARPRACDLVGLPPGAFYGRRILLSEGEWAYRLDRGHYSVRARLETDARDWFARAQGDAKEWDPARIFNGMKESNLVEIELR